MGQWLLIILGTLAAGWIVGYVNLLPTKWYAWTNKISLGGLVLLLAIMGAKVGSDPKIVGNFGQIGWQALILALVSVVGSVLLVWLWQRLDRMTRLKKDKGWLEQ